MSPNAPRIDIFRVDTHYPGASNTSTPVVLYGELGTETFAKFHSVLKENALLGNIDYVIRHFVQVGYIFTCNAYVLSESIQKDIEVVGKVTMEH